MPKDKLSKKAAAQKILGYERGDLSYTDTMHRIDRAMGKLYPGTGRFGNSDPARNLLSEINEKKIDPRTASDEYEAYNANMFINAMEASVDDSNSDEFIDSQLPYSPEAEGVDPKAQKANNKLRNKMLKQLYHEYEPYEEE